MLPVRSPSNLRSSISFSIAWLARGALALGIVLLDPAAPAVANLVPNPSFETLSSCPTLPSQVALTIPWSAVDDTSPDLMNACVPGITTLSTPLNQFGNRVPYDGDGYAGFFAYDGASGYREYLQVPLATPLEAGIRYVVSFQVSLADTAGLATPDIGAAFTANQVGPIPLDSQLLIPKAIEHTGTAITKTAGWTQVRGSYIADGTERYLLIGNFNAWPGANVAVTQVKPDFTFLTVSYYYLDDVHVELECPDAATVMDFEALAVSGSTPGVFMPPYFEDGFVLAGVDGEIRGDLDPLYTGSAALITSGGEFTLFRQDGGNYDLCSFDVTGDPAEPDPLVLIDVNSVYYGYSVGTDAPDLQFTSSIGTENVDLVAFSADAEFDNFCMCPVGTCDCGAPAIVVSGNRFCVQGSGSGSDWSWEIVAGGIPRGLVTVTAPAPISTPLQLATAFRDSIVNDGPPGSNAALSSPDGCFTVTFNVTPFDFLVGPPAGPAICTVNGNPLGCPFNPILLDTPFLPPAPGTIGLKGPDPEVPGLGGWALVALMAVLLALGVGAGRRVWWVRADS